MFTRSFRLPSRRMINALKEQVLNEHRIAQKFYTDLHLTKNELKAAKQILNALE